MPDFVYRGRAASGDTVRGRIEAASAAQVASHLSSRNVTPVDIREAAQSNDIDLQALWRRMGGGRPDVEDMIMFCRQMHTITRAGLPLLKGLQNLADTTHNGVLADTLREIVSSLESGRGLSASMARHLDVFPRLMINIVEIGEVTGTLDDAFKRLHEYLGLEREIAAKVKSATRYPMMVLIAIAVAIGIITAFVIPSFAPVFRSLGDAIPLPTKIIMGVSSFVQEHGGLLLAGVAGLWFGFRYWRNTPDGRYRWDKTKLRLPVVGVIIREVALARITRSLALALESGLPANETLTAIAGATGNAYMTELVLGMRDGVERGESLTHTAAQSRLFTPLVLQMIAVGEETGAVSELLAETAEHYEREVNYRVQNLSAAMEPLLIIAVGGCVLVLALGVFLPLWDMIGRAKGM